MREQNSDAWIESVILKNNQNQEILFSDTGKRTFFANMFFSAVLKVERSAPWKLSCHHYCVSLFANSQILDTIENETAHSLFSPKPGFFYLLIISYIRCMYNKPYHYASLPNESGIDKRR